MLENGVPIYKMMFSLDFIPFDNIYCIYIGIPSIIF